MNFEMQTHQVESLNSHPIWIGNSKLEVSQSGGVLVGIKWPTCGLEKQRKFADCRLLADEGVPEFDGKVKPEIEGIGEQFELELVDYCALHLHQLNFIETTQTCPHISDVHLFNLHRDLQARDSKQL